MGKASLTAAVSIDRIANGRNGDGIVEGNIRKRRICRRLHRRGNHRFLKLRRG
ncbi:MAG: hypothetical protein KGJ78_10790 [Alphaproteobacteria bacterium]|nr:hypothetical protein [Alphaproteobacteria bacterium]